MDSNLITKPTAPAPSPLTGPETLERIDFGNTIKVANNYETQTKIKNIITNILDVTQNDIKISQLGNDLVIKIVNIEISDKVYNNIIPKIKTLYFEHYKKIYSLSKNEIYNILEDNISIDVYEGSIILILKIHKSVNNKLSLSDEEKDLLEYYNFIRVFHKGLRPITTYELKKMLDEKYKNEQK